MQNNRFWLQIDPFSGLYFPYRNLSIMDSFIFTHFLNENTFLELFLKNAKMPEICLKMTLFL